MVVAAPTPMLVVMVTVTLTVIATKSDTIRSARFLERNRKLAETKFVCLCMCVNTKTAS